MILRKNVLPLLGVFGFGIVAGGVATAQNTVDFSYTTNAAGPTSAGVYDESGALVRVLWTMKQTPAGANTGQWDGKDDLGNPTPPGKYNYKVVLNRSTYSNIGVIGNTGSPPMTSGHVPTNFEGVAVDASGAAYTVHDWNEPHFDIIKWDPQTGRSVYNTGRRVADMLKSIAVEPDGSCAYVTSYKDVGDRTKSRFSIWRIKLTPNANKTDPFTTAGKSIDVYAGNAQFPEGAGTDQRLMTVPLLSLALDGGTLYATDSLKGRVLAYDKVTGELKNTLSIKLPVAVTVGDGGNLWVGHEHNKVSLLDKTGNVLSTPVTDLTEVSAVTYANGKLYIADQGAGKIRVYRTKGPDLTLENTFGDKARPGDRAPGRFIKLRGLAVDGQGNITTVSNGFFFNDGRIAKFTPQFTPVWRQMGLEFTSVGTYDPEDPDTLYSVMHHAYKLDRKTGNAEFLGGTYEEGGYVSRVGGIKAITLRGNKFVYMANGDGLAVYRVMPPADESRGPSLRLASIIAGSSPLPNGTNSNERWKAENYYLWTWNDEKGDGKVNQSDMNIFQKPEDKNAMFQRQSMLPDAQGNIWFASADWGSGRAAGTLMVMPVAGFNKLGNPIYKWNDARVVVSRDQFQIGTDAPAASPTTATTDAAAPASAAAGAMKVVAKFTSVGSDGSIYAYGSTLDKRAPQNGALHMGGNILARFQLEKDAKLLDPAVQLPSAKNAKMPVTPDLAKKKWMIILPKVCVGLDIIPPGPTGNDGVMVGGHPRRGGIHHYTKDGLMIGEFMSDEDKFGGDANKNHASGVLDQFGAISVSRDPRDGILDVFAEDDYNLRILWYRVDDRNITTTTGSLVLK